MERLFNPASYRNHLQREIEKIYAQRKNTKDPREMACFDEQISLTERLKRDYDAITDYELGEIDVATKNKKLGVS